jgi:hypothetical protein
LRLFEIRPGDVPDQNFSIWHLDLDHVVCIKDNRRDVGSMLWWVEVSNSLNFFVTKACFDRIMKAWESKSNRGPRGIKPVTPIFGLRLISTG